MRTISRSSLFTLLIAALLCIQLTFSYKTIFAQEGVSSTPEPLVLKSYNPQFLSPLDVVHLLGANQDGESDLWIWIDDQQSGEMNIRLVTGANLVLFNGPERLYQRAMEILAASDVAPRQIEIEVRIVEINTSKAEDLGYDWTQLLRNTRATVDWTYDEINRDVAPAGGFKQVQRELRTRVSSDLLGSLRILDEKGFGSVRVAPRILTLNNHAATVIDGQRVTYVTRYSSYSNLYETDSMDAGLIIKTTPSSGESGYITLNLATEFTTIGGSISGSPIKTGQIIENTVVVREGESALLGGFSRQETSESRRRLPVLGHLIPFLFSRKTTSYSNIETIIVLTPHVVDFDTAPNAEEQKMLQGE